jgi:amino acid permease
MALKNKPTDVELIRMYYEHQYDRIGKNEDQALAISNIMLTISALIVTFGFGNRQSFGAILVLFLPVIIIVANLFAILYIAENDKWIKLHRTRAQRVIENYASELHKLNKEIARPHNQGMSRKRIQSLIHYLFICLGVLLFVILILELLGVSIV